MVILWVIGIGFDNHEQNSLKQSEIQFRMMAELMPQKYGLLMQLATEIILIKHIMEGSFNELKGRGWVVHPDDFNKKKRYGRMHQNR
jgi:hypothetical protein